MNSKKEVIHNQGVISLAVQLGDLHIRIWFGIAQNLVANVLLGTIYIDRCIRGIFAVEPKSVPVS